LTGDTIESFDVTSYADADIGYGVGGYGEGGYGDVSYLSESTA
jgi:hypothetical protein